jgi:hypothetical protein
VITISSPVHTPTGISNGGSGPAGSASHRPLFAPISGTDGLAADADDPPVCEGGKGTGDAEDPQPAAGTASPMNNTSTSGRGTRMTTPRVRPSDRADAPGPLLARFVRLPG